MTTVPDNGSDLPFPPTPTASTAGYTLAESSHQRRVDPSRLPDDAPNILIVLLDDVGFGVSDVVGGEVHTPAFARIAHNGLCYNTFHTTSICSPTRAALLTGRNHHRVHSGTIAERALDWDGYTGVIGKDTATVAEVLQHYGYCTAAFGKWHNSPATRTTTMGPFDRWPNGHGFDHFYGFVAGETSQWEPRLYENRNAVEPPEREGYHLSEDLADNAISWLRQHESYAPDKPFFMYWASGAVHGPHHIFSDWADKYAGKFDDGWDAYRERVFAKQKDTGWIPPDAQLTPRADTMQGWDDVPESQRPFQRRLMEIFAGFLEHVDTQIGRILDELERLGRAENTLVIYIFGDNGSSAEGQKGSISELLAQNNIPNTVDEQLDALDALGGLDALGSPKTDNMYHAGWAWAGSTPFHHTKLVASHFGGTRNPMAISWPKRIKADGTMRNQFHHVNDIAPTIYDIVGITHRRRSTATSSSRWTASASPTPSTTRPPRPKEGAVLREQRQPWHLQRRLVSPARSDRSCRGTPPAPPNASRVGHQHRAVGALPPRRGFLAGQRPRRNKPRQTRRTQGAVQGGVARQPCLAGGRGPVDPHPPRGPHRLALHQWRFDASCSRMPEFNAPGLGRQDSHVEISLTVPEAASGVIYALGGFSGGITLFMDNGALVYEYNMLIIDRYQARSAAPIAAGQHVITVDTVFASAEPMGQAMVTLSVDGAEVGSVAVARTVPVAFTACETFGVGKDLGSPVSPDYFDLRPFAFEGSIDRVDVQVSAPGSSHRA